MSIHICIYLYVKGENNREGGREKTEIREGVVDEQNSRNRFHSYIYASARERFFLGLDGRIAFSFQHDNTPYILVVAVAVVGVGA